ncbi:MAG: hypothetical protein ACM3UP_02390 [Methanocella sp.]
MVRGRWGFGLRPPRTAAFVAFLAGVALGMALPALAAGEGEVGLVYTYGEVVQDDEGAYTVDPTASLGLEFSRSLSAAAGGRPALALDASATLGLNSPRRAGLTLNFDWPPMEPGSAGRRYSLSTSWAGRWPVDGSLRPEESWGAAATVHNPGLGAANLEAGGRASAHLNRLSGRDYRETSGYLATRFGAEGEGGLFAWLDPAWLGGFGALLTPPPEPGSEERLDLPAWFERMTFEGLPALPKVAAEAEKPAPRLTVITRHTQTTRTYTGDPESNWESGVTRLEARERRGRNDVSTTYSHTLKLYPADGAKTYELDEGELEIDRALRSGRARTAVSFRRRQPWEDGGEAYQQAGLSLDWDRPSAPLTWKLAANWRGRWYSDGSDDDYALAEVEGGVSRSPETPRGSSFSLAAAVSRKEPLSGVAPDEYRLRMRLSGEFHPIDGQTVTAGLAWERSATLAAGGSRLVPGPTETLLRLGWKRAF